MCLEAAPFFLFVIPSRLCSDAVEIFPASQLANYLESNPCVYWSPTSQKSVHGCTREVAVLKRCVVHGILPLGACTLEVAVIRSNRPIISDYYNIISELER